MKRLINLYIIFVLASCSGIPQSQASHKIEKTPTEYKNVYAEIPSNEIHSISSIIEWAINFSDPQVLYELAENIAIIRIDSIDGAININELDGGRLFPSTIGKFTILQTIKGNLAANHSYRYARLGGILPYEQYVSGLLESEQATIQSNMQKYRYVESKISEDIEIEPGIVYLAYFSESKSRIDAYQLEGAAWGLRKLEHYEDQEKLPEQSMIRVWDSLAEKWTYLNDLLPKQSQ